MDTLPCVASTCGLAVEALAPNVVCLFTMTPDDYFESILWLLLNLELNLVTHFFSVQDEKSSSVHNALARQLYVRGLDRTGGFISQGRTQKAGYRAMVGFL